jgi:hypothetical protein
MMIVEISGEFYKACFSDSGNIKYYKMIDGEWSLVDVEEV